MSITHRARQVLARLIAALTITAGVLLAASPAQAASGYIYRAPGYGYGFYSYNNYNSIHTSTRLLTNPAALASGYCYDIWLDHHKTNGGHYDKRGARSCRSSTQRDTGTFNEGAPLSGLNKLAVCYGPINYTNSPISNCTQPVGSMSGESTYVPSTCSRVWVMNASGTPAYFSGGDSYSCTS